MYDRVFALWRWVVAKLGVQVIFFLLLSIGFAGVVFYGVKQFSPPELTWEFVFLYIINAAVFLALFRHYPKLGVTMLVFILFFELAIFGYYFFSSVSLLG